MELSLKKSMRKYLHTDKQIDTMLLYFSNIIFEKTNIDILKLNLNLGKAFRQWNSVVS